MWGGKTEKGLEGIEKSLLKKKSSLAKTRPNFIVRVSPCECESSLRLLPRVVNKICYRIKHACFHSSSRSPRFAISVCGGSHIQRCTRVRRRHTVFHNLAPLAESDSPVWGGREKEKFGRVFTGAHTTISFDILYSMIEKPLTLNATLWKIPLPAKRSQVKFSHMNAVEFSGQSSFRTEVCDVISDGEFKTPQYLLGQ